MADLRQALTEHGFDQVATYIASGNLLFAADGEPAELESIVEALIRDRFDMPIAVVVRTRRQLREVVSGAPVGFGGEGHHWDVVFLKAPLTVDAALAAVDPREGVDRVWPGDGVLYFARLSERRAQSRLSAITGLPEYQNMTIRNWATTTSLLALLDQR